MTALRWWSRCDAMIIWMQMILPWNTDQICDEMVPYDLSFDHDNWQKSAFEEADIDEN
jgi:hypothetical protein